MRWWLAGAFVLIAVLTAALIASVSSRQVDRSVRANSEDVAVGKTVSAAFVVERAVGRGTLDDALPQIAQRRELALFVFGGDGRLLGPASSHGVDWRSVPDLRRALRTALSGHRFVRTTASGATVTALPLRRTSAARALVSYAARPPAYGRSLSIFRHEVIRAALWAVLAAAGVGLVAAALIARRLRRIDAAAAAIERGRFDVQLQPRFRDEIGSLAVSIDRMRRRLRSSFQQLEAERDRLGRLLEQLHEGVVAVDATLGVQFANRAAREIVGRDVLAQGLRLPDVWQEVPLGELARGLFRADAQIAQARADADDRTISIAGVPAGGSELAVLVLTDVTEQERRERAEREFVANASHELRTPVSAIVGAVDALQSGAKDDPADRERFIALVERQAGRLSRLIHSLLLLARAQTQQGELQLETVRVRPLLESVAAVAEAPEGAAVRVDCPAELAVLAQPDLADQVLANLVANALKHAPAGEVRLSGRREGPNVVLEVRDDGGGMSAETRQRVFDRFFSGREGRRDGFGLGLAIVRDAVRALGGSVELQSSPGGGTLVRVVLAAAAGSREAAGFAGAGAGKERA
jgi:two-component system sensor histidine kinase VicK